MVMFCPKCGALLIPKGGKSTCSCGYSEKSEGPTVIKEATRNSKKVEMGVASEQKSLPLAENEICPKCQKKGAYYYFVQTRAADEPETRFLQCSHCKHSWREYA